MLFNSSTYLAFLPIVVLATWRLPKRWRPAFLLLASYVFYGSWSAPYLLLVIGLTAANYPLGLAQSQRSPRSRALVSIAVAVNLGALMVFKYLGLLDDSARALATALNLPVTLPVIQLVLPIGLSFFTFEFIHYQVDLYRGGEPMRDPVHFALFPAFFPTQIAGPIKRYQDFGKQLRSYPDFDAVRALEGAELVAVGLFKKVVIADSLLPIADAVFRDPASAGMADAWAGLLAFSFQIYMDFSGYTDIGRGSAQLLGYTVPVNFRSPYLATSLRDFWRRWHMSLSSWLRDYLYIPLGGSRAGPTRTRVNLLLTMALGGLWHGAAWHFLGWGIGHGAILAVERAREGTPLRLPAVPRIGLILAWAGTQLSVLLLWSVFRAPGLDVAASLWAHLVSGPLSTGVAALLPVMLVAAAILAAELAPASWRPDAFLLRQPGAFVSRPLYVLALGALSAIWITTSGVTHSFIYFQF